MNKPWKKNTFRKDRKWLYLNSSIWIGAGTPTTWYLVLVPSAGPREIVARDDNLRTWVRGT